jgi:anti-sigma B factor antagonist
VTGNGLEASRPGRYVVVTAPAEIDVVNVSGLIGQLTTVCRSLDLVIVDMTATTFCDSAGVRALARAWQLAVASGGELRLAIGGSPIRRVLQLTGLDQVVPVYHDVEQSLSAPGHRSASVPGSAITGTR